MAKSTAKISPYLYFFDRYGEKFDVIVVLPAHCPPQIYTRIYGSSAVGVRERLMGNGVGWVFGVVRDCL